MGVRKTADFLEKATWTLAISLLVLCLISTSYTRPSGGTTNASSVSKTLSGEAPVGGTPANNAPAAPAQPSTEKK